MSTLLGLLFLLSAGVAAAFRRLDREDGTTGDPDPTPHRQHIMKYRTVAWFHPPKAATSFGLTLHRWASWERVGKFAGPQFGQWGRFWKKNNGLFNESSVWVEDCDHETVSREAYSKFRGHFAGLFRQPEQRVMSAWHDKGNSMGGIEEYAERAKGTVVMQLAGQAEGEKFLRWPGNGYCGGRMGAYMDQKPTPNLPLALKRLKEGFMFVGLVEQYDLSVCLFHAMFGGECVPPEFRNMRPGLHHADTYNTTLLKGHEDEIDGKLYEAAKERFWSDIIEYGVTRSRCQQLCPHVDGVFDSGTQAAPGTVSLWDSRSSATGIYDWPGRYHLDEESQGGDEPAAVSDAAGETGQAPSA